MDIGQAGNKNPHLKMNTSTPSAGFGGKPLLSLTGDKNATDKEKITILAREFESIFTNQMLKAMRSSIDTSGLIDGGRGEAIFKDMLDEEMARQMAYQQNDGLSSALAEQLMQNMGATAQEPPEGKSPSAKGMKIRSQEYKR